MPIALCIQGPSSLSMPLSDLSSLFLNLDKIYLCLGTDLILLLAVCGQRSILPWGILHDVLLAQGVRRRLQSLLHATIPAQLVVESSALLFKGSVLLQQLAIVLLLTTCYDSVVSAYTAS